MYFRAVELFVICVDRRDGGAAQREAPASGGECCSERAHASFWRFRLRDAQRISGVMISNAFDKPRASFSETSLPVVYVDLAHILPGQPFFD